MPPRKRAAEDSAPTTRSSKAAKTDGEVSPKGKRGGKKGGKAAMPATAFKAKALPLHLTITHTPPAIPDDDKVPATTADPGLIGALSLVPSTFATGSYGWKGSKRITVELQGGESEEKEKVQVMLTINATVVNSKNAGEEAGDAEEQAEGQKEEAAAAEDETEAAKDGE